MVHTFFSTSTIDLSSPSQSTWTRFKSGDCPICQGERKDCRQSPTTGLVFCLYSGPPKDPEWVHRTNDINGFGVYGKKRTEAEIAIDKATWLAEKKQREEAEKKRQAQFAKQVMPVEKRDRHYHQLLAGLSQQLHPDDWADLSRRGISDQQAKRWLITSVGEWQELGKKFPNNLPGIGRDRHGVSQLWNGYPGYIVPTRSPDGKITSLGQVRNRKFRTGRIPTQIPVDEWIIRQKPWWDACGSAQWGLAIAGGPTLKLGHVSCGSSGILRGRWRQTPVGSRTNWDSCDRGQLR